MLPIPTFNHPSVVLSQKRKAIVVEDNARWLEQLRVPIMEDAGLDVLVHLGKYRVDLRCQQNRNICKCTAEIIFDEATPDNPYSGFKLKPIKYMERGVFGMRNLSLQSITTS